MKRRLFVKGALFGAFSVSCAALLKPLKALAAWPENAFKADAVNNALQGVFGASDAATSDQVVIKAPLQAENGAVVPIKVTTTLPNPKRIAIIAEKNPRPLAALVNLGEGSKGYYSARIKMAETMPVNAYVESDGKIYVASQTIKVTVGGCGG